MTPYVDSDWGTLRDVLVCPFDTQVNPTTSLKSRVFAESARDQHAALVDVLSANGAKCHLLSADVALPYKCFVRDSLITTPWGVVIPRMGFRQRDTEPEQIIIDARIGNESVWRRVTSGSLEGGDVSILRNGIVAIGCNGFRTSTAGAHQSMRWFHEAGWDCRIIPYSRRFMHLDIILGVIDAHNVICCTSALAVGDLEWLAGTGMTIHSVSESETRAMACNVLSIDGKHVITCDCQSRSARLLRDLGYAVTELNLSTFVGDGGGVHCLVQPLRRDPTPRVSNRRKQ